MALTFNGVSTTNLSTLKKPTGFSDPQVTPVTGDKLWQWPATVEIDRADVYNADRATTLENILDDVTHGLNTQCETIAEELEHTTNTVTAYAELLDVRSNTDPDESGSDFYLNVDGKFICDVIIYAKVTV